MCSQLPGFACDLAPSIPKLCPDSASGASCWMRELRHGGQSRLAVSGAQGCKSVGVEAGVFTIPRMTAASPSCRLQL